MTQSWKITAYAPRDQIEAALVAHEDALVWDSAIVLSGREVAEDRPQDWVLEAWLTHKPRPADKSAISGLFGPNPPPLETERLPDADWVTLSQQGIDPIRSGRFHVRTPDHLACTEPGIRDFIIPASRAFGTGQHETTSGCLAMLGMMKAHGVIARNIADIGTGTGLLAFAALSLWPRALATASDIDPVCAEVVGHNATANGMLMSARAGSVTMVVADGMSDPLLAARGPYDLLIANILAGPLVELAPDFARAVVPGGHVLLSGLLETQEPLVRKAYRRAGFRLARHLVNGHWSVLWMRKRAVLPGRHSRISQQPYWMRE